MPNTIRLLSLATALAGMACAGPSAGAAVFRSVAPDNTVSYSDQPQPAARDAAPAANSAGTGNAALPYALRQAAARYPVVLYTSTDCTPCTEARSFLRQRGIPFSEKTINTPADIAALQGLANAQSVPVIAIGAQQLTGFAAPAWTQYLDAAGYPKESRLPRGWQEAAPTPLAPVETAKPAPAAPTASDESTPAARSTPEFSPTPNRANPANIRF